jgi:hypothetical protein
MKPFDPPDQIVPLLSSAIAVRSIVFNPSEVVNPLKVLSETRYENNPPLVAAQIVPVRPSNTTPRISLLAVYVFHSPIPARQSDPLTVANPAKHTAQAKTLRALSTGNNYFFFAEMFL